MDIFKDNIEKSLFCVPDGVDYTSILEDVDFDDIETERIGILECLLYSDNIYYAFQSARLLTNWGVDSGLNRLVELSSSEKKIINNRIYEYDETYTLVLRAFVGYWFSTKDQEKRKIFREKIYPVVTTIIREASYEDFDISCFFRLVASEGFFEYIPLLKEYLINIIEEPDQKYWKIHDVIELFWRVDRPFLFQVLEKKGKKLSDFGIKK